MIPKVPVYFVGVTASTRKHLPLALGLLHSYARSYKNGLLLKHFDFKHTLSTPLRELADLANETEVPGIWLFSNYVWSEEVNLKFSSIIKQIDPNNITIHGGPSVPKYESVLPEYLKKNSHIDIAIRGEGEEVTSEVFESLIGSNLENIAQRVSEVKGLAVRTNGDEFIRTPDRDRISDVNIIPSPYLNGIFENYNGDVYEAMLETNRGCPYGCTFCDWGSLTLQKIKTFDINRIYEEIEWIGKNKIPLVFVTDANFGIFERDLEIAQRIVDTRTKYGFPREVCIQNAKNNPDRVAHIQKIFYEAGLVIQANIAWQTTDSETLKVIKRSNIKNSQFQQLMKFYKGEKRSLVIDLMVGLPGQTIATLKTDLQKCIDEDVIGYPIDTVMLPNSPMADPEYIKQYKIEINGKGEVISTFSFSFEDLQKMRRIGHAYELFESFGLFRYILRYLQWDHGIPAIDVIEKFEEAVHNKPSTYPVVAEILSQPGIDFRTQFSKAYEEFKTFIMSTLGVSPSKELDCAFHVNYLHMPAVGRTFPAEEKLEKDFVTYIQANRENEVKTPLSTYGKGSIHFEDPNGMCEGRPAPQYAVFALEVESEISRPIPIPRVGQQAA